MATLATPLQPDLAARNRAPAQLWLPRWELSRCVRAVVSRSTLGLGRHWPPEWHHNHFPATPLCTISWFMAGHSDVLTPGQAPLRMPQVSLARRLSSLGRRKRESAPARGFFAGFAAP